MTEINRKSGGRSLSGIELLLCALIGGGVLLFVLYPITSVLCQSVIVDGHFSLGVWKGLFTKNSALLFNSFAVAGTVTALTVPISVLLALKLFYGSQAGRKFLIGMLILSTISPPFVGSMSYLMLFGRRGLITWHLLGIRWNPYGFHGIVLMETISQLGIATLLAAASFRKIDGALERASTDLGASATATIINVTLPLAAGGIGAAALMVFVRSLADFGTPLFVGGRFQVLSSKAYNTLIGLGDFPTACAMNALLVLPALLLLAIRRTGTRGGTIRLAEKRTLRLKGAVAWILDLPAFFFIIVQMTVYGMVFLGSITRTWGVDFTLTLSHLRSLWSFTGSSIARSLTCAVSAGVGGALTGAVAARLLNRLPEGLSRISRIIIELPYLVPGTFFGVGYLLAASRTPWQIPAGFLIAANCMFRQLSPSLWSAEAGLGQINPELEPAVRDLGGGRGRVLGDIILPALRPFMLVSFINSFSASMTSTGPIIFLVTPFARVASVELFESINSGHYGDAAAMATLLTMIILLVNAIAWRISAGRSKSC